MPKCQYRVLLVSSHPVQYVAPLFRKMALDPRLDIQVAYCSLQGAEAAMDREFGIEVKWDVPLLEGYSWVRVPNRAPRPGLGRFFGLINPGLWGLIASGHHDAIVIYTGYFYLSFWIALAAAKFHGRALVFGSDGHQLASQDGKSWKVTLKRLLWPRLFGLADVVIVSSSAGVAMMQSLGIPRERLVLTPGAVDNEWWIKQAGKVDRSAVRRTWGLDEDSRVVLFCAKLQRWKRPLDALNAFARAEVPGSHLVYAGEGPLRRDLESQATSLGIRAHVHFFGFINQSQLPAVYRASDVLVLPSAYEPFGLVVNEAMLCGCPAIVSDRVGAGHDLVLKGQNGNTFPSGDVDALAALLRETLCDRDRLRRMGEAARRRMETWSPREAVEGHAQAFERAARLKSAEVQPL
jgi:glycosyltransferase involved in cell wall biosynthesis